MFYLGLDLGKLRDFTAFAVVERTDEEASGRIVPFCGWSPASDYQQQAARRGPPPLRVRYVERVPLGTPYLRVVDRIAALTRHRLLNGASYLTVDATGAGLPVVESLRASELGCRGITAVTITGGERAS